MATDITKNSGVEMPKLSDAEAATHKALAADEAARQILAGMEGDKFRVVVGNDAKMMDRLYRLSPRRATEFIAKQMAGLLKH